jgi:hypothetical protein
MKRVVFLTVAALMAASMVFAQGGSIGMFADAAGTNCNLPDAVPGLTVYYVVHVNTPGATACEFFAPKPTCVLATYLSDASVFPVTVGTSQTGVSIGYGMCLAGPINVLKLNFFTMGTTGPCCYFPILPHPVNGGPWMVDCANTQRPATGGKGIVHAMPTCQCNVPAEDTTWGQVKSLYSE